MAAFILTYAHIRWYFTKETAERYSNAFFIFILIWKLSVILFQWELVKRQPLSVVYFDGGLKGFVLGTAAALIYLLKTNKYRAFHAEGWIVLITVYELVFYLFNQEHILLPGIQLIGNLLAIVWIRKKSGNVAESYQILVLFTAFQAFMYSLKGDLLSVPVITYTAVTLLLVVTAWKGRKKNQ